MWRDACGGNVRLILLDILPANRLGPVRQAQVPSQATLFSQWNSACIRAVLLPYNDFRSGMTTRYLFLCPDLTSASGGIAVIYDMVALLNRLGYDAAVVHNSPAAGYPDHPQKIPLFYTRRIWQAYWRYAGARDKIEMLRERLVLGSHLKPVELRATDVIVTPEFHLAESIEAFRGWPLVVFVQNPFALMMSHRLAVERGLKPDQEIGYWCGIADVCQRHLEILGATNIAYFPVSMKPEQFPLRQEKSDLITYMPRKRPWEAKIIDEALRRRGKIGTYQLKALDGIPRLEVARYLGESRIFISLLRREALGFPAAEAMASGCIVIGFDGLGCEEYFNATTGIPVTEGDVAGVVNAVERTVAEYDKNPARLDAMRKYASDLVNERYSTPAFEAGVVEAWRKVDQFCRKAER